MAQIKIVLPDDKLELIERERESTGETQTEFFIRLLNAFAKRQEEAEDRDRYNQGHEQRPETEEEIALSIALALHGLEVSPWDE